MFFWRKFAGGGLSDVTVWKDDLIYIQDSWRERTKDGLLFSVGTNNIQARILCFVLERTSSSQALGQKNLQRCEIVQKEGKGIA